MHSLIMKAFEMYGIYTRPHNQTLVFVRHAKWLPTTSATISVQWVTATIAGPGCSGVIQVLGFSPQRQSFFFFLAPEGVFLEILHIPQFLAESWRIPHEAAEEGGICITDHERRKRFGLMSFLWLRSRFHTLRWLPEGCFTNILSDFLCCVRYMITFSL